ncbi:hypothetical protein AVEN_143245-1 [Araneus ventricosus]|uniref:Uncharacterized protein n=1 Tax=Araneus ventricosus TaxID=182803 RepID=A0A4Y2ADH6_ARAVE|nr:hypothetical protein AVEN_143245-1 [Araneus ventricosus]
MPAASEKKRKIYLRHLKRAPGKFFKLKKTSAASQIRLNRPIKSKIAQKRSRCARHEYKHRCAPETNVLTTLNRLPLVDNELAIQSGKKRLRTLNLRLPDTFDFYLVRKFRTGFY